MEVLGYDCGCDTRAETMGAGSWVDLVAVIAVVLVLWMVVK